MHHHHKVKDVRRDADHVVQDEHNVAQVEHNVMQVKSTKTIPMCNERKLAKSRVNCRNPLLT